MKKVYLFALLTVSAFAMRTPQMQSQAIPATLELLHLFNWEQVDVLAYEQWPEAVSNLLAHGARVNSSDVYGRTPLIRLAEMGSVVNLQNQVIGIAQNPQIQNVTSAIAQLLINAGADVNRTDLRGQTALGVAAARGNLALVRTLLDAHAQYDPFMILASIMRTQAPVQQQIALLDLFLRRGFNINAQDTIGNTLLHVAAATSIHPEIIQYLIGEGADPLMRNNQGGVTPLDIAAQLATQFQFAPRQRIVEILLRSSMPHRIP